MITVGGRDLDVETGEPLIIIAAEPVVNCTHTDMTIFLRDGQVVAEPEAPILNS